jgi:hypothetical protein
MEIKQATIAEILETEYRLALDAREKHGDFYKNVADFNHLLQTLLVSVNSDRFVFVMFLSQVRKHIALALFSSVRLHHVQAMMDLRQALEAGACAAYAIANPDVSGFAESDESGSLDASQELAAKRYKWLEATYPAGSAAIKRMKVTINSSAAHSNIVYAQKTFAFESGQGWFSTPFFDIEDDFQVKTDLWGIANSSMGLMDILYRINVGRNVIKFRDDFGARLLELEAKNNELKAEMLASPRLARWVKER